MGCATVLTLTIGACDTREDPVVASLGPPSSGTKTFSIIPTTLNLFVGQSALLKLKTSRFIGPFNWRSSQPRIASVDDFGIVTGVGPGIATISVTAAGDPRAFASATVVVRFDNATPP